MESFNKSQRPSFIIKPPFRFVEKYEHCFETFAKGRWVGRKLIDVLNGEYKAYTREYYVIKLNFF